VPIVPRQVAVVVSSNASIPVAATTAVQIGSVLYCAVRMLATQTVTGVTDSQGNSWSQVATANVSTYRFYLYKAIAGASGANTVTVTLSSGALNTVVWVGEVTGMGTSPTDGPSNSLDVTVAEAPLRAATLGVTQAGIALAILSVDSSVSLSATAGPFWVDGLVSDAGGSWIDLGASSFGSFARAAIGILSGASVTVEPKYNINPSGPRTGESMTAAIYGEASSGETIVVATQSPILAPPRSILGY